MKISLCSLLAALLLFPLFSNAAEPVTADSTIRNFSSYKRSLSFSGLLQLRYSQSLTKDVDVNGKNFAETGVTNSFSMRRVRLQTRATINDHFDAVILMNLAEFSSNPQNKVLENAFIGYHLNSHFNMQLGQFRPFFGPEDILPVDIIKSLDYSNQYYAFANSGWQGFQMGFAMYGNLNAEGKMPIKYYAGVSNGNNRNQASDEDNGKDVYGRLELHLAKNLRLGMNAASGSVQNKRGNAMGADISGTLPLCTKLKLEVMTEYKEGTNFAGFGSAPAEAYEPLKDYRLRGFYVFPNLRYELQHPRFRSLEFSARYEYLDENYKIDKNKHETITPMLSLEFSDDYYARLQLGCMLDRYAKDIPLSTKYTHTMAVAQVQVRF